MESLTEHTNINIVWFKRDLRTHDHAPLTQATLQGIVLPLYIVEPQYWQLPDSSCRHWHFMHDCLTDLDYRLKASNARLIIRLGNVTQILNSLHAQYKNIALWSHEETGNDWTFKRDKQVKAWCDAHNVPWHEFPSNGVVRILKDRNLWSNIRNKRMQEDVLDAPACINLPKHYTSDDLPTKSDPMFGNNAIGNVQNGGRTEGLKVLYSFLRERGRKYIVTISKPGISARHCSRLSAHLAFGTLSVREVEHATKAKMASLTVINEPDAAFFKKNLNAFLSRLAWRCHFIQKLEQQPSIEFLCMHPAFEGMREPYFREDYFEAWKSGSTGYPLIDACMRSLHANGWINFRMRAMLVSFASYHLWLDWRRTAPYLATLFTDYEPGIHYAQFQMQSGVTGINAVRMYNPVKQSLDNDPDGTFIRRYVPELKHLSNQWIHEPWRSEALLDYAPPIVNHAAAIQHAKAQISKCWKADDFREQAKAVYNKLGSRNRPVTAKKKTHPKSSSQYSLDI